MDNYLTCSACGGRKQVAPLGGILKDCALCNGIGYTKLVGDATSSIDIEVQPIKPSLTLVDAHQSIEIDNPIADQIKREMLDKMAKKSTKRRAKSK